MDMELKFLNLFKMMEPAKIIETVYLVVRYIACDFVSILGKGEQMNIGLIEISGVHTNIHLVVHSSFSCFLCNYTRTLWGSKILI